jgi:hypothetical protein
MGGQDQPEALLVASERGFGFSWGIRRSGHLRGPSPEKQDYPRPPKDPRGSPAEPDRLPAAQHPRAPLELLVFPTSKCVGSTVRLLPDVMSGHQVGARSTKRDAPARHRSNLQAATFVLDDYQAGCAFVRPRCGCTAAQLGETRTASSVLGKSGQSLFNVWLVSGRCAARWLPTPGNPGAGARALSARAAPIGFASTRRDPARPR